MWYNKIIGIKEKYYAKKLIVKDVSKVYGENSNKVNSECMLLVLILMKENLL